MTNVRTSLQGALLLSLLVVAAPRVLVGQERGAVTLGESVAGLDVTARVLVIGAHPDDEDTSLITWLARGRQVEAGYLSLTRGDGGQNLIGNELGVLLGMIRTEELLAARRVDGGRQFFTRAYDFGFSKTADETYRHWPRELLLRDVVTVVRSFRPQIIVAVFSGTPADGHGHHQVSAILAREAFDAAADTVRFPAGATLGLGPWSPDKFYRAQRGRGQDATVGFNVGELSPLRGRTYAEIASESRSQHLSQGFGSLQRHGTSMDYLKLEVSRVSDVATKEASPLQGIASDWSRFRMTAVAGGTRARLDSLPSAIAAVRAVEQLTSPAAMVSPLAKLVEMLTSVRDSLPCSFNGMASGCTGAQGDLAITLETATSRATAALLAAAGVLVEATAPRELVAVHDTLPVTITVYNQGRTDVVLEGGSAGMGAGVSRRAGVNRPIPPDSAGSFTTSIIPQVADVPWWLAVGKDGDVFRVPAEGSPAARNIAIGEDRVANTHVFAALRIAGAAVRVNPGPVVYRFADPAKGEQRRPVASVPAISVMFDGEVEYARAAVPLERTYNVRLHNAGAAARGVTVTFSGPAELKVDSAVRRVAIEPFADAVLVFRVKGMLPAGRHVISATAASGDETFGSGYVPIHYDHINPLRFYRAASVQIEAVQAALPRKTTVAYIRGVGDNVATMLGELGMKVTMVTPEELADIDLSKFGSVVVGPRAFAAYPSLAAQSSKLQAFARNGGTVVVQYGQQEIQTPGILPYPVALKTGAAAERVTDETAPVVVLAPGASLLAGPNKIGLDDFSGWVQERSTYMPTTVDPHYQRLLGMHDPGEPVNENSVLVAPVGKGAYVYVTLALFRQLPSGVPGAARIFLNLMAADGKAPVSALP
ncbi:MAG: LmbE family protein [Gemmatimonadetes bacterium]|nr:LmbE family protein [Gemmatimonadota bacterium]